MFLADNYLKFILLSFIVLIFQEDSEKLKIGGDHLIQYFKIRNGNIPKLADHIFMGMKIEHLYIHNCSKLILSTKIV